MRPTARSSIHHGKPLKLLVLGATIDSARASDMVAPPIVGGLDFSQNGDRDQ